MAINSLEKSDKINEENLLEYSKLNSNSSKSNDSGVCKLGIVEYKTNLNIQSQEHVQSNIFINEFIGFIIKKHDEGLFDN